jgi:hypothetical protein
MADKMPDNYLYLGLLATLFPRASDAALAEPPPTQLSEPHE